MRRIPAVGGWVLEEETVGSDRLEELLSEIVGAVAGSPDHVTLELSYERFGALGLALDAASESLAARGYRLVKVVAEGTSWHATYERMKLPD